MSRKFKKFASMFLAIVMTLALGSVAMAETVACPHDVPGVSGKSYEKAVTVKIIGQDNGSTDHSVSLNLPEEYHVRVVWNKTDGLYNATKTDTEGKDGFKNFYWDCGTLQYKLIALGQPENGKKDVREGNWVTKPAVAFEVTNASTPTLDIAVTATLKNSTDTWASYMYADSIATQNDKINHKVVPHVLHENMGSGQNSYEKNLGAASHNVFQYDYVLNWNYDALNQQALDLYNNGWLELNQVNTFVVTITAE